MTYKERKAEKIMGWSGERGYENERLVINDAQDRNKWRRCCRKLVDPG